jgi:small subunit ribosomal protein S2
MEEKEKVAEVVVEKKEVVNNGLADLNQQLITVGRLLEAGAHFGHYTHKWNPKMKKFIYTSRGDLYIINLEETKKELIVAYNALRDLVKNNTDQSRKVLFVGTKETSKKVVKEQAQRSGSYYITERWLGGTLTNFKTIKKSIAKLKGYEKIDEDGWELNNTKLEIKKQKTLFEKLKRNLLGIKEMESLPLAVVVVNPDEDPNAVLEAKKLGIPTFGVADTNSDPEFVNHCVPGNNVGKNSVALFVKIFADAILEGRGGTEQFEIAHLTLDDTQTMTDAVKLVEDVQRRKREERKQQKLAALNSGKNGKKPYGSRPFVKRTFEKKPETVEPVTPVVTEGAE